MGKIPVGATLSRSVRFVVHDFLRILGVMTIPMVVMWIPSIFMRQRVTDLSARLAANDVSALRPMMGFLLPFYVVTIVLLCMQMIGIARIALGLHRGWFYFSLGKPVWRFIGSFLLLIVALIVGYLCALLGGILLAAVVGMLVKAINVTAVTWLFGAMGVVGFIALWCAYIYCLVRLSFLLCPVIAAEEEGFALGIAWNMGKGNFWRMFAIILAIMVPMAGLELWLVFGYMFKGLPFPSAGAGAEQKAAFDTAIHDRMIAMTNAMYHYWYISFPLMIVFMIVFYGLVIGAQCAGYQALKSDPIPGNALPD